MNFKNKNIDFLLMTLLAFFLSFLPFGDGKISPIFMLSGSIFIIISFKYGKRYSLLSILIFFLLGAIFINEIYSAIILSMLFPFYLVGIIFRRLPYDYTAFFVGFSLFALSITVLAYGLNYFEIFSLETALETSINDAMPTLKSSGLGMLDFTASEVLEIVKNFFPTAIVKFSIFVTLINISIANKNLSKDLTRSAFKPFNEFFLPNGIFIPMLIFILVLLVNTNFTNYLQIIFDNLASILETLVALQGLAVVYYLSKNIKGFGGGLLRIVITVLFLNTLILFSFLGFFDIMFNLRKLTNRS